MYNDVSKTVTLHPKSRYGFGSLSIGESMEVKGVYRIIRISAYGFRKRWGMCFLVKDLGEGKVLINRYK